MASSPLRFGLVGTGHWARIAHAPALASASAEGLELAAVWGRDPQAAAALAKAHGAVGYQDSARSTSGTTRPGSIPCATVAR